MVGGVCIVVVLVVDFNGFEDFGGYFNFNVFGLMIYECFDCLLSGLLILNY